MTSVWLLPAVTLIVPSSVGGELALSLQAHSTTIALITLAFTIFILSIGLVALVHALVPNGKIFEAPCLKEMESDAP